ncbi:MAG: DUF1328 domain-containing protein [Alphaproteobacteria bacterium]
MFVLAAVFLLIALISGLLGFGAVAATSMEFAKIIFVIALVLVAVSLLMGLMRGRPPRQ